METNYLENRLKPQIEYYSEKSKKLKIEYQSMSFTSIIIMALIPVFTLLSAEFESMKYIIAFLSAIASILSAALLLRHSQENWIAYRTTCEALKAECEKYTYSALPYHEGSDVERNRKLVEACEEIMRNEHNEWKRRSKPKGTSS